MTNKPGSEKPGKTAKSPKVEKVPPAEGAPAVAKEDVNVPTAGQKPKEVSQDAKPKKKPGSRLMDFTG